MLINNQTLFHYLILVNLLLRSEKQFTFASNEADAQVLLDLALDFLLLPPPSHKRVRSALQAALAMMPHKYVTSLIFVMFC